MEFKHISVLLEETIKELHIRPDGIYVDGTLGGGGHAYEICKRLSKKGRYIGIDQDADAIAAGSQRLEEFKDRVTIVRDNYVHMPKILQELGIDKVDGILLSSFKLSHRSAANASISFGILTNFGSPSKLGRGSPSCI